MKAVVDDKIPYINDAIESIMDEVVYLPGSKFTPELIRDADVLIVRTRTRCDRSLLEGSNVKFIATATIGFDHIDTAYLHEAGIAWTNCPGCNASSVGQYVRSCLILLQREKGLDIGRMTLGVVGVGHVGTEIVKAARELGVGRILKNDPPKQQTEGGDFVSLQQIVDEADVITFHTPLTRGGEYPTFHLADDDFFDSLKRKPVIINSSRGEVVSCEALLKALRSGSVSDAIIDTWEGEPDISLELLERAYIATPHVAGYSVDGKANASRMSVDAVCRFFGLKCNVQIAPPSLPEGHVVATDTFDRFLELYNPHNDSHALKSAPEKFEFLRGNYPLRRETDN